MLYYVNDNIHKIRVRHSGYNSVILNNITILRTVVSLGVGTEGTRGAAKKEEKEEGKGQKSAKVTKLRRRGAVRMTGTSAGRHAELYSATVELTSATEHRNAPDDFSGDNFRTR